MACWNWILGEFQGKPEFEGRDDLAGFVISGDKNATRG
jgi:hypothetical protein